MKIFFILICSLSLNAFADVSFTWKVTAPPPQPNCEMTTLSSKLGMKMSFGSCNLKQAATFNGFLYDASSNKFYMLNDANKTATLKENDAQLKANSQAELQKQMDKMKEVLAKMPAEMRKKFEKTMTPTLPTASRITYKDLGKKKIGKWNCQLVQMVGAYTEIDMCLVNYTEAGFTKDDMDAFMRFADALKDGSEGMDSFYSNELMIKYPNMVTVWTQNKKPTQVLTELVTVQQKSISKDQFSIAGYKVLPAVEFFKGSMPAKK